MPVKGQTDYSRCVASACGAFSELRKHTKLLTLERQASGGCNRLNRLGSDDMHSKLQAQENVTDYRSRYLPCAAFRSAASIRPFRVSVQTRVGASQRQRSRPSTIARWFSSEPAPEGPCSDPRSQGQLATWQFSNYYIIRSMEFGWPKLSE